MIYEYEKSKEQKESESESESDTIAAGFVRSTFGNDAAEAFKVVFGDWF